jgi:hypothetical protein
MYRLETFSSKEMLVALPPDAEPAMAHDEVLAGIIKFQFIDRQDVFFGYNN